MSRRKSLRRRELEKQQATSKQETPSPLRVLPLKQKGELEKQQQT